MKIIRNILALLAVTFVATHVSFAGMKAPEIDPGGATKNLNARPWCAFFFALRRTSSHLFELT